MIPNTDLFFYNAHHDETYGSLTSVECGMPDGNRTPFEVRRVYYIYNVPGQQRRGFHSHNDLEQVLLCVHGSVKILVKTPFDEEDILLDDPNKGLYIGPMIWREMYEFSDDAVLLVLASKHYDVDDYIRDYSAYELLAKDYFERRK